MFTGGCGDRVGRCHVIMVVTDLEIYRGLVKNCLSNVRVMDLDKQRFWLIENLSKPILASSDIKHVWSVTLSVIGKGGEDFQSH